MKPAETHIVKLPERTVQLRIEDLPDLIIAELRSDRYGDFQDELLIEEWLRGIVAKYEGDERLVFLRPS